MMIAEKQYLKISCYRKLLLFGSILNYKSVWVSQQQLLSVFSVALIIGLRLLIFPREKFCIFLVCECNCILAYNHFCHHYTSSTRTGQQFTLHLCNCLRKQFNLGRKTDIDTLIKLTFEWWGVCIYVMYVYLGKIARELLEYKFKKTLIKCGCP